MNLIDIVLGIILLVAFYVGFKKGLFVALASLIGIVAGVFGAIYFSDFAAGYISKSFDWNEQTVNLVAFAVTFLAIIFLISLAGKFLTKIADFAMLGVFNKLLGGVFNAVKYAFIISVIFMFINSSEKYTILSEEDRQESILYGPVASIAPSVLPEIIREFKRLKDEDQPPSESEVSSDTQQG